MVVSAVKSGASSPIRMLMVGLLRGCYYVAWSARNGLPSCRVRPEGLEPPRVATGSLSPILPAHQSVPEVTHCMDMTSLPHAHHSCEPLTPMVTGGSGTVRAQSC